MTEFKPTAKLHLGGFVVVTALVTPFKDGNLDLDSFVRLLDFQIQNQVIEWVVGGSTGESACLSDDELEQLIQVCQRYSQAKVWLGLFGACTRLLMQKIQRFNRTKIYGFMIVTPFYNKPPFRGVLAHYQALAQVSEKPLMIYHVPSRTQLTLSTEELVQLAQIPSVEAIKEAHDPVNRYSSLRDGLDRSGRSRVRILSGDDLSFGEWVRLVPEGEIVSVASNIVPAAFKDAEVFRTNLPLIKALYAETNPIPIKMALYIKGIISSPECRLPLMAALPETERLLRQFL